MADFIGLVTDVMDVTMTIGTTTLSLGALALGGALLAAGVGFYKSIKGRR